MRAIEVQSSKYMLALVLWGGCGPQAATTADETGATGGVTGEGPGAPTTGEATGTTAVATGVMGPMDSSGAGSTSGSSTGAGTDSGATFLIDPDGGGTGPSCDVFAQDCPDGMKCAPYAEGGGTSWNSLKCVPVVEEPAQVGEPCVVEGNGTTGVDDCAKGVFCWDIDAQNHGTCYALCGGVPEQPLCAPGFFCDIKDDAVINLCLAVCDPLVTDCAAGEVCVPDYLEGFHCTPGFEDGAAVHEACEYLEGCEAGLLCMNTSTAVECDPGFAGCCEPYCDVSAANVCPGQGQVCLPFYGENMAPPAYANVGLCAVPT